MGSFEEGLKRWGEENLTGGKWTREERAEMIAEYIRGRVSERLEDFPPEVKARALTSVRVVPDETGFDVELEMPVPLE